MTKEALVNSPPNHGRYLHGAGKGCVTVAQKNPDWQQPSYQTQQLNEVLPAYGGLNDVYISQNRFWGSRAVSNLPATSFGILRTLEFAGVEHLRYPLPRHPQYAGSLGRRVGVLIHHDATCYPSCDSFQSGSAFSTTKLADPCLYVDERIFPPTPSPVNHTKRAGVYFYKACTNSR